MASGRTGRPLDRAAVTRVASGAQRALGRGQPDDVGPPGRLQPGDQAGRAVGRQRPGDRARPGDEPHAVGLQPAQHADRLLDERRRDRAAGMLDLLGASASSASTAGRGSTPARHGGGAGEASVAHHVHLPAAVGGGPRRDELGDRGERRDLLGAGGAPREGVEPVAPEGGLLVAQVGRQRPQPLEQRLPRRRGRRRAGRGARPPTSGA